MNSAIRHARFLLIGMFVSSGVAFAQLDATLLSKHPPGHNMLQYSASPNHREIARRALELAITAGFADTGITVQEIQSRIEAGAYSEDYDLIPGIVGAHYPNPWDQGPEFDFAGKYPFTRIPYGPAVDTSSGWYRGLPHAYDPVQNIKWPGAKETTIEWANSPRNSFTWDHARSLYEQGKKADAYECLGHLLHLLADGSIPQHLKLVGAEMLVEKSGTILDPDIAVLVADEYQMALSGGLVLQGTISVIPDLLGEFRYALTRGDVSGIPHFSLWDDYFRNLAEYTYYQPLVQKYYAAPTVEGQFGRYKDESGNFVSLHEYGLTLPSPIGGRWTQFSLRTTARIGIPPNVGPIIPEASLKSMCDDLVSKAAEYCAGFLLHFKESVALAVEDHETALPTAFSISQNYPNPFNPSTTIRFSIVNSQLTIVTVYDVLGREVATLMKEVKHPGVYTVQWDARRAGGLGPLLPSGVYFYRVQTGDLTATKRMVLLK